ncbi:Zinc finger DNL-type [Penicillium cf. griseofulvum]|uniref:Zinc finger DNL-type n=1 Tax=Penicillium cf. griseofulvum TaxID=2972120 RepID=A0A9W9T1E3_9EURO|nr:Zinc finger DNL-type [Penicillium cf. griseofulvum]KAJ5441309.1 Zinc finger DNL-type [Penicillium cf. griseofulvum]KAJ5449362.1 Zinc finger DNL-type [Penicillium cf. griseofulvum]
MRPFTMGLRPLNALVSQAQSYTTIARTQSSRFLSTQSLSLNSARPSSILPRSQRILAQTQLRFNSRSPRPLTESPKSESPKTQAEQEAEWEAQNQERRKDEEAYRITFTCKPCGHRSAHRMSKHGYHRGTVLIQCPSCDSRHVMSDHLGVFFEKKTTLEDILKEKGQTLTHGHTEGNLEFWEDGSVKSYDLEGKEIMASQNDKPT